MTFLKLFMYLEAESYNEVAITEDLRLNANGAVYSIDDQKYIFSFRQCCCLLNGTESYDCFYSDINQFTLKIFIS